MTSHSFSQRQIEKMELIACGHVAFQFFWAGIELGLYDLLSRRPGLTEAQIGEALGLAERPTRILIVGLLSLEIIERKGEAYRNCDVIEAHLVRGKDGSMAPIFGWQAHIVYPGLIDFVESLRQNTHVGLRHFPGRGENLYQRLSGTPLETVFQDAMSALTAKTNPGMLEAYDFGRFGHLLDVGGGDATNAIALARAFPGVRVTVFDMPSVCAMARQKVRAAGLEGRITVHEGDFLSEPFPVGVDAVIFNHILVIWSAERNLQLLRKACDALPSGGCVFIYNMMCNDDDRGPLTPAFGSTYFLAIATGEGMLYRWKDYEGWLADAGFARVKRVEGLPLHHGLIIGTK